MMFFLFQSALVDVEALVLVYRHGGVTSVTPPYFLFLFGYAVEGVLVECNVFFEDFDDQLVAFAFDVAC